jgi:hypothetical protein
MNSEDLLSEGERAKRHLRIAQVLALLAKSRRPSLVEVQAATTRLQAKQPAVAMAIILAHAKRQPLHERGDWLKAGAEALHAYRLGDGADQKEADLAHEHIEREIFLHKAELARLEKLRERVSLALLCLLVIVLLTSLGYVGYTFVQDAKEPVQAKVEKSSDKKTDPKTATAKTSPASTNAETKPAEAKKTEKDSQTAKPANK